MIFTSSPSNHRRNSGANQARELLWFTQDFHTPHIGSFEDGYNAWFLGGQLNASFNCID